MSRVLSFFAQKVAPTDELDGKTHGKEAEILGFRIRLQCLTM